jgi:phosphoribosylanthranilate isomerase
LLPESNEAKSGKAMQRVRVKICGVRLLEEAKAAVEYGAHALGFNFWSKSPRFVAPEVVREIIQSLPPFITCVGVFVNETAERINEIVELTRIQVVQLHGDEKPEFVTRLNSLNTIKAFRVDEHFDIKVMKQFPVGGFLLDAKVKGEYGGTGVSFNWQIAIEAKKIAPIILAGGINSDNVTQAIQQVQPYAIDVCSGLEAEPGRKDLEKLREFLSVFEIANRVTSQ